MRDSVSNHKPPSCMLQSVCNCRSVFESFSLDQHKWCSKLSGLEDFLQSNTTSLCTSPDRFNKEKDQFLILHQNVRSLKANFNQLMNNCIIQNPMIKPDIIAMSEVWSGREIESSPLFQIPGYNLVIQPTLPTLREIKVNFS